MTWEALVRDHLVTLQEGLRAYVAELRQRALFCSHAAGASELLALAAEIEARFLTPAPEGSPVSAGEETAE